MKARACLAWWRLEPGRVRVLHGVIAPGSWTREGTLDAVRPARPCGYRRHGKSRRAVRRRGAAAEGNAGDRRAQYRLPRHVSWTDYGRVPPGTKGRRLR